MNPPLFITSSYELETKYLNLEEHGDPHKSMIEVMEQSSNNVAYMLSICMPKK